MGAKGREIVEQAFSGEIINAQTFAIWNGSIAHAKTLF